jgi:RNA polymerase sigma-70 factor (ECF subfamily)
MSEQHPELDRDLMGRLATGDASALEPLYDRYCGALLGLVTRVVGDRATAEELMQETFLLAWKHASAFDPERGRVLPWLLSIAHHLALNELRRRRRRPQPAAASDQETADRTLDALIDPGPAPEDLVWARQRRDELERAMTWLPEAQRAVIVLYASGCSQSQIADRLGQPLGTVKTRMRRGMQSLRTLLEGRGISGL